MPENRQNVKLHELRTNLSTCGACEREDVSMFAVLRSTFEPYFGQSSLLMAIILSLWYRVFLKWKWNNETEE